MSRRFLTPVNLPKGNTLPLSGSAGDLFFKSDVKKLYVYDGTAWAQVAGSGGASFTVSEIPPESSAEGDVWVDSATLKNYVFYDNFWIQIATPTFAGSSSSGPSGIAAFGSTAPTSPATGQFWYDTFLSKLVMWNGTSWFEV